MRIALPRRKRAPEPPAAPADQGPEAELLEACQAADGALAGLSVALAARRRALVRLSARTGLLAMGAVNRQFSPSAVTAAIAAHGAIQHFHLAYVLNDHRRTLSESARSAIEASAAYRKPEPADPANEEEPTHALTDTEIAEATGRPAPMPAAPRSRLEDATASLAELDNRMSALTEEHRQPGETHEQAQARLMGENPKLYAEHKLAKAKIVAGKGFGDAATGGV